MILRANYQAVLGGNQLSSSDIMQLIMLYNCKTTKTTTTAMTMKTTTTSSMTKHYTTLTPSLKPKSTIIISSKTPTTSITTQSPTIQTTEKGIYIKINLMIKHNYAN